MENNNSNIEIKRGPLTIRNVKPGLKKNADSAEVHQTFTKVYPAIQSGSSLSSGLFPAKLFGEGQSYESNRVAFVDVPLESTIQSAQIQLDTLENACIYKIFSYDVLDVMSKTQIEAMESGFSKKDIEFYQEKYAVLDSEKNVVEEDGNVLYASAHFMDVMTEDINLRQTEVNAERVTMNDEAEVTTIKPATAPVSM